MKELNPKFFEFGANQSSRTTEIADAQYYDNQKKVWLGAPLLKIKSPTGSWPACIGPFQSGDPLLLRHDVVEVIQASGLTGLSVGPVEITKVLSKKTTIEDAPGYFQVKPMGRMSTAIEVYERYESETFVLKHFTQDVNDPLLNEFSKGYGRFPTRAIPREETWDGLTFFVTEWPRMFGGMNCALEFVELAHQHQWDNINFSPIDRLGKYHGDFRSLPWPPELWYPENQIYLYK